MEHEQPTAPLRAIRQPARRVAAALTEAPTASIAAIAAHGASTPSRLRSLKRHLPLALPLALACFLLTINVALPWHSVYEDNGLAFESIAINHIRFGLAITKGASLADTETLNNASPKSIPGVPNAQEFHYLLTGPVHTYFYADHPPLLGLTIAGALLTFGYHFWVVRLVPIAYSVAGLIVFYLLLLGLFDDATPWFASLLYATFPMLAYFGRNVAHEAPTLFWALLLLTGYLHWRRSGQRRWLALVAGAIVVGGLYGWPMFYFAAIVLGVDWLAARRLDGRLAVATAVPAVGTFAVVWAQIVWVLKGNVRDVLAQFVSRSGSTVGGVALTPLQWLSHIATFNRAGFGAWSQLLLPALVLFLITRFAREGWTPRLRLVAMSFLFGLSHVLIFREGAYVHTYWQFYFLPFYALSFGWAATWLLKSEYVKALVGRMLAAPWQRMGVLALIALLLLGVEWHVIHGLYTSLGTPFVPITHYVLGAG